MFRSTRGAVVGWLVVAACLVGGNWEGLAPATAAEELLAFRTPSSRTKKPPQTPTAEPDTPVPPPPQTPTLGDDHEANVQALLQEKIETIRQRAELVRRAASVGKMTQNDVDRATVSQIRAELEVIDRPTLRIAALEKLIEALKRLETDASEEANRSQAKGFSAQVSAHGHYVNARVERINAQISLEKERIALAQPEGAKTEPAKTEKPK